MTAYCANCEHEHGAHNEYGACAECNCLGWVGTEPERVTFVGLPESDAKRVAEIIATVLLDGADGRDRDLLYTLSDTLADAAACPTCGQTVLTLTSDVDGSTAYVCTEHGNV